VNDFVIVIAALRHAQDKRHPFLWAEVLEVRKKDIADSAAIAQRKTLTFPSINSGTSKGLLFKIVNRLSSIQYP